MILIWKFRFRGWCRPPTLAQDKLAPIKFVPTALRGTKYDIRATIDNHLDLANCFLYQIARMSMFRAKKLDIGCFVNIKVIRDHTKRKVFAEHETER